MSQLLTRATLDLTNVGRISLYLQLQLTLEDVKIFDDASTRSDFERVSFYFSC